MKVQVVQGSIQEIDADAVIVNLFEGVQEPAGATRAVDEALEGAIRELIEAGDITGKAGQISVLYPRGAIPARRVLVAGLGPAQSFGPDAVRRAMAAAVQRARELNAHHVASIVHGAGAGDLSAQAAAQATMEGLLLGLYKYYAYHGQQTDEEEREVTELTLVEFDGDKLAAVEQGVQDAEAVVLGVTLARNLVNMPPNYATPSMMASVAEDIAQAHDMELTIGDRAWAEQRRMGGFLAVAKGAGEEPKFIVLEHNAGRDDLDTIVLVGKGITFDSGGLSIKPREGMERMKSDMGGAAAVLGAMKVAGLLDLPLHVIGIVPATENMPDGRAYHPADVVVASNGVSIEIISTDAEGRMVLADGLVFAGQYKPKAVIDLATLTGSSVIALGRGMGAGLFSNDEGLRERLMNSAHNTSERLWPMPLWDDYKESIKSDVADIKNSGGKFGGVGTSAMFLKQFTDYPWAHVDMAGMALTGETHGYLSAGGTGFGVRLLVDLLRSWSEETQ